MPRRKDDPDAPLTPKQRAFVEHYTVHLNATEAYRHAYPASRKSTAKKVATEAGKLLNHPRIETIVRARAEKVAVIAEKKFEITAERVLQELAAVAFQNSEDYFEWGSYERPKRRKNKETGTYDPILDEHGDPIMESVPYAKIKPSDSLTRVQKAAIVAVSETISRTGDRVIEAKMADKMGALKLLGQHLALFKERVEHTGKNGGPIEQHVTLPQLENVADPVEALKQFEQFRTSMHAAGHA